MDVIARFQRFIVLLNATFRIFAFEIILGFVHISKDVKFGLKTLQVYHAFLIRLFVELSHALYSMSLNHRNSFKVKWIYQK